MKFINICWRLKPLLSFLIIFASVAAKAQQLRETIHLDLSDGLDQNTVFAMTEDSLGAIWIGTPGGLHRYNGAELVPKYNIEETVLDLHVHGRYVFCLTIAGLHRIDITNHEILQLDFTSKDYFNIRYFETCIALLANIQDHSLFLSYDLKEIQMPELSKLRLSVDGDKRGSIDTEVGKFYAGPQGAYYIQKNDTHFITKAYCPQQLEYNNKIFIASHEGLWEVKLADSLVRKKLVYTKDRIECLFIDQNRNLWVGSSANGVYMFHRNSLNSEFYPVEDDDGSLVPCWAIFQSETETFVGTSNGVRIIDGAPNHPLVKKTNGIACYSGIFGDEFLLIGTAADGIYRFSNSNMKRVFFNNREALDNTIIYMIKNSNGFLACTKRSFVQLDKYGDFLFQRVYNEVPMASYAMWIEQVDEGYRCASTTGISWLTDDLKQKHMTRHDNARVFNMCDDSVCVSMDGGLYRLKPDSTLVQSTFPDNQLLSIINK